MKVHGKFKTILSYFHFQCAVINRIKYLWQLTSVYIFLKKEQPAAIINLVSNLPQTDYQDSVTVASVVNPNFYQRQNLPQFGDKK